MTDPRQQLIFSAAHRCFIFVLSGLLILLNGCGNQEQNRKTLDNEAAADSSDQEPITIVVLKDSVDNATTLPKSLETQENAAESSTSPTDSPADNRLVRQIRKEFRALELGDVTFLFVDADEFIETPRDGDLVIYPPHRFGDLKRASLLRSIPSFVTNSDNYRANDVLRHQRLFGTHSGIQYAISNGTTSLMLLVRTDILRQHDLSVPKTWAEYDRICRTLLEKKESGELVTAETWSPTIEPMKGQWKAVNLFSRSASYIRARGRYSALFNYTSWNPLIDAAPFQKSLGEMKSSLSLSHEQHRDLDPRSVEQAFLAGESVMAVTWPHPVDTQLESDENAVGEFGIFQLPGSRKNFSFSDDEWVASEPDQFHVPTLGVSGQCLSILKSTRIASVAARRIGLLTGKQFSGQLFTSDLMNGFPCRASQLTGISDWVDARYSDAAIGQLANLIETINDAPVWMMRPRIAGSSQYERILSKGIEDCLRSQKTAEEALKEVNRRWSTLNQSMDLELQKKINLESLGVN